jgi:predicted chitinase
MPEAINFELAKAKVPTGPYPGLRPFEPYESGIFFGREVMAAEVIAKLGQQNLIIVHGASGCGKSSLVRAGVLPALQRDHDLNRQDFRYSIIRPSQGPLEALAAALLAQLGPVDPEDPDESWLDRAAIDQDLVETIEQRLDAAKATLCLVVDQFEEIFRWAAERDLAEAEFLVDFLCRVARRETGNRNFFILVTMRSDYLGQCAQFQNFAGVVNQCQYLLDNLDEFGILRAIHDPADRFGGTIAAPLADRLRFMAKEDADALPILQHTLMCLYDALENKERGWTLDLESFGQVSGDHGALHEHVERTYQETVGDSPERAAALEWMFRALTDLDAGGRAIRRPCRSTELAAVSGVDEATVLELVEAFARPGCNFLVVAASERGSREVDISHEALIRRWRRIGDNNVDAKTGLRLGWLFREFQAGLIWKALAVFAKRGEKSLEPSMTKQWLPFFDEVGERPAWAARYFVDPLPGVAPVDQPEWTQVGTLIAASRARCERENRAWRRVLFRYWSLLVAVAVLATAVGIFSYVRLAEKADVADGKAADARADARTARQESQRAQRLTQLALGQARAAQMRIGQSQLAARQAQQESRQAQQDRLRAQQEMRDAKREAAMFQQQARAAIVQERARADASLREMGDRFTAYQADLNRLMTVYGRTVDEFARDVDDLESTQRAQPAVGLPSDFRAGLTSVLTEMGASPARAELWAGQIEAERGETGYALTNDRRLAAFLAAASLSTQGFTRLEEELDFDSAEAVRARFPQIGADEVSAYVHRPLELANRAYRASPPGEEEPDNLLGTGTENRTGNTLPEDGWTYRGRGLIPVRGRDRYRDMGDLLHENFVDQPDLVNDPRYLMRVALARWQQLNGNRWADIQNLFGIARHVSGVTVGRERIMALEERARRLIVQALGKQRRGN